MLLTENDCLGDVKIEYLRRILRRKFILSPYFIVSEGGKRGESVERFRFANENFPAIMAILERLQRKAPLSARLRIS